MVARGSPEADHNCLGRNLLASTVVAMPLIHSFFTENKINSCIIAYSYMNNVNICGRFYCSAKVETHRARLTLQYSVTAKHGFIFIFVASHGVSLIFALKDVHCESNEVNFGMGTYKK